MKISIVTFSGLFLVYILVVVRFLYQLRILLLCCGGRGCCSVCFVVGICSDGVGCVVLAIMAFMIVGWEGDERNGS